nr:hypothetical transcript [Hymenolepis microstoma]
MLLHQSEVNSYPVAISILRLDSSSQLKIILATKRIPSSSHCHPDIQDYLYSHRIQRPISPCCLSIVRQNRRSVTVILASKIVKLSLMQPRFHKTSSSNHLLAFMIFLCLITEISCLRDTRSKILETPDENIGNNLNFEESQKVDFCYDAEGERHGLFSSWHDPLTGCQCSCQSVGNILVSVCDDNCDRQVSTAEGNGDSQGWLSQNDEPFSSLLPSKRRTNVKPKALNAPARSCLDESSGNRYLEGQSWMSNARTCAKCYCLNGTADCESSVLHCQSSCLPGQKHISTGPCCEHKCIGDTIIPNAESKSLLVMEFCKDPEGKHGEVVLRQQQCVDQRCQCINGNWFCIDTCTPLEELDCVQEERIFWDPFCCPRCKGTKKCNVTVSTINWLEEAPGPKELSRFVSVFNSEGQQEGSSGKVRKRDGENNEEPLTPISNASVDATEKTTLITVDPAQHLVTHAGRCVCTDGELRCSRPGTGIWHDTDCYYSNGNGGRYYAKGARWKAYNDECSDCQCLEDRKYTCKRAPCSSLFLCPPGEIPAIAAPEDCCPSTCKNASIVKSEAIIKRITSEEKTPSDTSKPNGDDITQSFSVVSPGGQCKPLGDLGNENQASSNIFLPSKSLVIIRRSCVSLKCVCSSEGNWVCADYCIPCEGVSIHSSDDLSVNAFLLVQSLTADGCCPKCSEKKEAAPYFTERYSIAITCFLALLALAPLFVIASCCIYLRYRKKLKKLRILGLNHPNKFQLDNSTPQVPIVAAITHSTRSSYAIPLTISTSPDEKSSTPPIRLRIVSTAFADHDSSHGSLLFNDSPQLNHKDLSIPNLEDATIRKSLTTSSITGCSVNCSSKVLTKVVPAQLTPHNDSPVSNFPTHLRKSESPELKRSSDWKTRLRRSSTQPRTHFFPQAWKTILSKSAKATTPTANQEEASFFSQPKSNLSESFHQLIQTRNTLPLELTEAV